MAQIFVKLHFQLCEYESDNYPEMLVEIILVQRKNGSFVALQLEDARQSSETMLLRGPMYLPE